MLEVGLFGGWNGKAATNELGNANGKAINEIPQSGPGGGVRASYGLFGPLDLEIEVKYGVSRLLGSGDAASVVGARGLVTWNFLLPGAWTPLVRVGGGAERLLTASKLINQPKDVDFGGQVGAGVRRDVGERWGVRFDATTQIIVGRNNKVVPEFEFWLGVYRTFGSYRDTDADGLRDRLDKCPTSKEDLDGWQDADGCLDADNDADGLDDGVDKCPTVAETKNGFEDDDGCADDPDTDGDGFVDSQDKCPREAESKNGWQDEDGCADTVPDTDGDGIADPSDKCVKDKETLNNYQDEDGCPDTIPERLLKYTGTMRGIAFESNKATILASSEKFLMTVVAILTEFKDTKVQISGHTDDRGSPEANQQLSLDRAEAVKAFLVAKGVAPERISTFGHGQSKPVADNATEKGRAANRRIDFNLE